MKRLLLATAAFAALTTSSSFAADMIVKAPVVHPSYDWSGFYYGVNVGSMRDAGTLNWVNSVAPNSFTHSGNDIFISGHVGVQWQFGSWVLGIEGSANAPVDPRYNTGNPQVGCPNPAFTCQARTTSFWTVGPKLGYAFDRWMVYGTGGYARGALQSKSFATATGVTFDELSQRAEGWFAGIGFDYSVLCTSFADILVGMEYQHVAFDNVRFLSPGDAFSPAGVNRRDTSNYHIDAVSARVTVKMNPWTAPVVARY
jgi:outer membrane immunogenic protein